MSRFVLRPYQGEIMDNVRDALRRARRVILQSATGSGKSVMIADMIRKVHDSEKSAWLICHRKELLDQLSGTLFQAGVPHGVIQSGRKQTHDRVQVASVQTLVRRLGKLRPPDLLAIDEAHHATAKTYVKVMEHCAPSWVVGLTATPCRTDGAGLDDLFGDLVTGPSPTWLMEQGYLARYRLIAPPKAMDLTGVRSRGGDWARKEVEEVVDQSAVLGDAVQHYFRHVRSLPGRPVCLVYCVSRAHARHVEAAYHSAGVNARYVAGDTDRFERKRYIEGFRSGDPEVIVSVDLFGEGLDVPRLDAVQLLRPTQSLGLHLQQVGRALRPDGDKVAVILDHVGNSWLHGLPDDEREWTLEGTEGKKKGDGETGPALRHCDGCHSIYHSHLPACPQCGKVPKVDPRKSIPDHIEGDLEEIDPAEHRRLRRREEWEADTLEDFVKLAIKRKYKAAWAGIRWAQRHDEDQKQAIKDAYRTWRKLA